MSVEVVPCTWRALPAWRVVGEHLEVVITQIGGHLASLRRRGEDLDPLWQPPWPGADPASLDAAGLEAYGGPVAGPLLATIVGSNLCCDRFGGPHPGEDKPAHGETCRTTFERVADSTVDIAVLGWLPTAALAVRRSVTLEGETCRLSTTVSHHGGAARAIEWCEHTNVGGGFLEGVTFTAPVDLVMASSVRDDGERFAPGPAGLPLSMSAALAYPAPDAAPCGDVLGARLAQTTGSGQWVAENRRLGRRLSCTFMHADWPWLALWTQHHSRTAAPWAGVTRVRGMELSTKPFPESDVPPERSATYCGRTTTCLIPPGAGMTKTLAFTWTAD